MNMNPMTSIRWLGLTGALVVGLSACSLFAAKPTMALISFTADEKVNVDARGRSTPTVVRYYILKNTSAFNSADFFSLSEKDQQTLGDAIVAREEFILKPGETKTFAPKEAGAGQEFAVMASFRNIDKATWRASVPLVLQKTSTIQVNLKNDAVTLNLKK